MKILILTFPFCGASDLAEGIAGDLNYKYFQDPMDITVPLSIMHHHEKVTTGLDHPVLIPRGHSFYNHSLTDAGNGSDKLEGYDYPDVVQENTVITHNVKWHKLPGNDSEEAFLAKFISKFDEVIALGTTTPEINWKSHCASLDVVKEDNYLWKKWALENNHYLEYKDSMLDNDLKIKHETAQAWLQNYAYNGGIPYVTRDEMFGYELNHDVELTKANLLKLGFANFPVFAWDAEKMSVNHANLYAKLRWDHTQGNKY
jgi:hypothetical protein|tara:strand:+ start:3105 stop:3878 length:774 start_codon:yes stop_codon:yes gene_type:complete